jgi:hypothetical protein
VGSIDGRQHVRATQDVWFEAGKSVAEMARQAAHDVAKNLLEQGADRLIIEAKAAAEKERDVRRKPGQ